MKTTAIADEITEDYQTGNYMLYLGGNVSDIRNGEKRYPVVFIDGTKYNISRADYIGVSKALSKSYNIYTNNE